MRRAIFDQSLRDDSGMGSLRCRVREKTSGRVDYCVDADFEHAFVGLCPARMRGWARRIAQDDALRPVRPVARGIGGTEDRDHRNLQSGCQVQGPVSPPMNKLRTPRERDQFCDGTRHGLRRPFACSFGFTRQIFFAGAIVENRAQTVSGESLRNLAITFGRPALRSPACTGIQDGELADSALRQALRPMRCSAAGS